MYVRKIKKYFIYYKCDVKKGDIQQRFSNINKYHLVFGLLALRFMQVTAAQQIGKCFFNMTEGFFSNLLT